MDAHIQRQWDILEDKRLMLTTKEYFMNIGDAVRTTWVGMKITLKYWVKEPAITVEYPDRIGGRTPEDLVSERFRGFLRVDTSSVYEGMPDGLHPYRD
jgi:hypothetical protein